MPRRAQPWFSHLKEVLEDIYSHHPIRISKNEGYPQLYRCFRSNL